MSPALLLAVIAAAAAAPLSTRPVVGIYSAPFSGTAPGCAPGGCDYVAASYVKWLEFAGARAVPIPYNASRSEIQALFPQLNGVLFPGGGAGLPDGARGIFDMALAANDQGVHFPVWGTCLGFEWLIKMAGGPGVLASGFDSENISMALELKPQAFNSSLFGPFKGVSGHRDRSDTEAFELQGYLSNDSNPPAMNNHQAGVTPVKLASDDKLSRFFNVLSTNQDRSGRSFVSTVEGIKYPVYGTQWHPEKNSLEWGITATGMPYEAINHSPEAIFVSQALANYFVGECRRNSHTVLGSTKLFWDYEISQASAPGFEQCYLLPKV